VARDKIPLYKEDKVGAFSTELSLFISFGLSLIEVVGISIIYMLMCWVSKAVITEGIITLIRG